MKVLEINGSPRSGSNTQIALDEMNAVFEAEGIEVECLQIGNKDIRGCIACGKCFETGRCVFDDLVNETAPKLAEADGIIVASPVYYGSANGTIINFLDRLFYSTSRINKTMKVGAAVACARRAGTTFTFDELNKYFFISGMPVASGRYWNAVHGRATGEATQDAEGLAHMRILARNMVFLMKSIALGKEEFGIPETESYELTNFIR